MLLVTSFLLAISNHRFNLLPLLLLVMPCLLVAMHLLLNQIVHGCSLHPYLPNSDGLQPTSDGRDDWVVTWRASKVLFDAFGSSLPHNYSNPRAAGLSKPCGISRLTRHSHQSVQFCAGQSVVRPCKAQACLLLALYFAHVCSSYIDCFEVS